MCSVDLNSESGSMEWELSKENVQPVKTGRNVEILNDALKAKTEGPARSSVVEQQHRRFLDAIENYVGEDPLAPWIRYIKWATDAYPEGGARSELLTLLETCTRKFQQDERYHRDRRFLMIWVQYADCSSDPGKVFAFLEANDIGQEYALFYGAYARSMEAHKKFSKADEIYRLGLHRSAQPPGRLESMYQTFLHRMLGRGERKLREEQQSAANGNDENDVRLRSFGPTAIRLGDAVWQQAQRHSARPVPVPAPRPRARRPEKAELSVFVDPEFGDLPKVTAEDAHGKEIQVAPWHHIGSEADNRKENVQQPIKWTDAKIGQEARGQHGRQSDLKIFVDEEFSEASNHKQHLHASKSAAPSLRLRLEDMLKIKRPSRGLRGSFLNFPEAPPLSMAQSSVQHQSESPRCVSSQDTGAVKPHPETVFGYDTSILNDHGTERSFDEFRLLIWIETQLVFYTDTKENISSESAGAETFEDAPSSLLPSLSEDTDMAKDLHLSSVLKDKSRNVNEEASVAPQSSPSQRKVDGDEDNFNCRGGFLLQCSNEREVNNHIIHSDSQAVDHPTGELATVEEKASIDFQSQSQKPILPSPSPGQPAIVDLNSYNSFTMQGDETVAIKRFADEVTVLGSDPKVNGIDSVSHHGLVEPTINTKEALADILDMFNKPLQCDRARPKARLPNDTKKRSTNPLAKSSGFEIFVDDDFDLQSPAPAKKNEKRVKPSSGRLSVDPVVQTCGLNTYIDENLSNQRPADKHKNDGSISRPFDSIVQSSGFHIHQDEDLDVQRPGNFKSTAERPMASSTKSALNLVVQSKDFDSFVQQDLDVQRALAPHKLESEAITATRSVLNPAYDSSAFQILVNDGFVVERPLRASQNGNMVKVSTVESSLCQTICVDDDMQELSLGPGQLDGKIIRGHSQDHCSLIEAWTPRRNCQISNSEAHEACTTSGNVLWQETNIKESTLALKENAVEVNVGGNCNSAISKILTVVPVSLDTHDLSKLTSEGTIHTLRKEMNAATVPILVSPWDERNLQDLLQRLKPQMTQYEGFSESTEKYSGSMPILSLRSSNARNKILQLGTSTYRLKGCIGQGAFAQVFEVEDEDEDLFGSATKLALKFQKPACLWEFYIYCQLDMRISNEHRSYYGQARRFHLYSDSSFMVCDYGEKGTLQDVVNAYLATGQRMDEVLCIFYTIEMLCMLEFLNEAGIIHGDFKPDNLLIRDDSDELAAWTPDHLGCWKSQGLSLIDWGRSIDITLYPEGTQFKGDCKTDSFRCPEMLEDRPWSFQVDTFGLCGVVHCLLHGNYMQIEKTQTANGQTIYRPKSPYKRFWNITLWKTFFETLLNVSDPRDHTVLSELRQAFEHHLIDKSLGKKLKGLLAKQTIMMFTRG